MNCTKVKTKKTSRKRQSLQARDKQQSKSKKQTQPSSESSKERDSKNVDGDANNHGKNSSDRQEEAGKGTSKRGEQSCIQKGAPRTAHKVEATKKTKGAEECLRTQGTQRSEGEALKADVAAEITATETALVLESKQDDLQQSEEEVVYEEDDVAPKEVSANTREDKKLGETPQSGKGKMAGTEDFVKTREDKKKRDIKTNTSGAGTGASAPKSKNPAPITRGNLNQAAIGADLFGMSFNIQRDTADRVYPDRDPKSSQMGYDNKSVSKKSPSKPEFTPVTWPYTSIQIDTPSEDLPKTNKNGKNNCLKVSFILILFCVLIFMCMWGMGFIEVSIGTQ